MNFQNIHTFTYKKTLLHTLFYLFLKSSKALLTYLTYFKSLQCILNKSEILTDLIQKLTSEWFYYMHALLSNFTSCSY